MEYNLVATKCERTYKQKVVQIIYIYDCQCMKAFQGDPIGSPFLFQFIKLKMLSSEQNVAVCDATTAQ
jgi:hypothetical protein